ncbi:hypothetical protein Aperf_G00000028621 [Anoplocephala perfoliata]
MVIASELAEKYLHNGACMPSVGLGTRQISMTGVVRAVDAAIDYGYRHIDCAFEYENETHIGLALRHQFEVKGLRRQDIFISSKLWCTYHLKDRVGENCIKTLRALNLEYLDLYLIHWPISLQPGDAIYPTLPTGELEYAYTDLEETWSGMEQLVLGGLVRSIGLANFNRTQILRILECCDIPPTVLQIESHPYFLNEEIINFARGCGMKVAASMVLGSTSPEIKNMQIMEDPVVKEIASVHGRTPAQVLIRFALQRNLIALPNSFDRQQLKENLDVYDFELTSNEMVRLCGLNKNKRIEVPIRMRNHPEYPFKNRSMRSS